MTRTLKTEERELIDFLLEQCSENFDVPEETTVMDDGGMGSISFDTNNLSQHYKNFIEAEYLDSDEQLVIITLTIDKNCKLFELDFWKTDFSPLVKYPAPEELRKITALNKCYE